MESCRVEAERRGPSLWREIVADHRVIRRTPSRLAQPDAERFRKIELSNGVFQRTVAAAAGGVEFLLAVGYELMHGYLVLQYVRRDVLVSAKAALAAQLQASEAAHRKAERQRISLATDRQELEVQRVSNWGHAGQWLFILCKSHGFNDTMSSVFGVGDTIRARNPERLVPLSVLPGTRTPCDVTLLRPPASPPQPPMVPQPQAPPKPPGAPPPPFTGIVSGLRGVSRLTGTHNPNPEKESEYECGFPAFEDSRSQFDVRFYLVAILFIIFDLEAAFLFPWAVSLGQIGWAGWLTMMIFLFELVIGLIYAWKKGALDWE